MKKIMIMWTIFAFIMVGGLTFIGYRYTASIKKYRVLEENLVESAQVYLSVNDDVNIGNSLTLKATSLLKQGYINTLDVKNDKCDGFVKITKKIGNYEYKSYIKCKDYTTIDYEKQ